MNIRVMAAYIARTFTIHYNSMNINKHFSEFIVTHTHIKYNTQIYMHINNTLKVKCVLTGVIKQL